MYKSEKSDSLLIEISLGLLAFVSIFYSFISKKEIKEKRDSIIVDKWKNYLPDFKKDLKNLENEFNEKLRNPTTKNTVQISQNIQDKLNDIALLETEIDIRRQLYHAVLALIISSIGFFIDSVTQFTFIPQYNFLPPKGIIFVVFLYGLYRTIELILTWNRIMTN